MAVLLAAAPVAAAGFLLGGSVRDVLDDVDRVPSGPGMVVSLDSGERRTLMRRGDLEPSLETSACTVEPLDGQLVTVDDPVGPAQVVRLGASTWTEVATVGAGEEGAVRVRCPPDAAWALAPDLSEDGFTERLGSALRRGWLLCALGVVAGSAAALLVAVRRRRPPGQ